ncbi:dehydrogenase, partial [Rhizobium leguminosarum]
MSFIFSTNPLHPAARSMLEAAGDLRVASAPDPETLLREGRGAGILVIR